MLTIKTYPGDHIDKAIQEAVKTARTHLEPVEFEFNGVTVTAQPGMSAEEVYAGWDYGMKRLSMEHIASPRYVEQETKRAQEISAAQGHLNFLIDSRAPAFRTRRGTLEWLMKFIPLVDRAGVVYPAAMLALELARVAPANTNVGRTDLAEKPDACALWVIGQVVDALEKGHSPHPMLADRASAFAAMLGG